ncbi:MAG: lipopolysaccharide heptosyltransferase II [Gemmatimonadales bacterium]
MPDSDSPPNILAVRFSSIGDVLLTTPLLRALRFRHPSARITFVTKKPYVPLLSANPHVNEVVGISRDQGLWDLAEELRGHHFSHLLDLHDSLRSRALRALVPGNWSSYPKHRIARAILIHTKQNVYRDPRPVAERYFSAARALDVAPDGRPPDLFWDPPAERRVLEWFQQAGIPDVARPVAIAPGAAHATKRWPLEYWEELTRRLVAQGCHVIVVGGADDAALGSVLARSAPDQVHNAAGSFQLQETGALLQRTSAVVSGDTGVMHIATAVGAPVVALFGPTVQPFGFFPYSKRASVLELTMGCRPCTSKGGPRCPLGHHRCLRDITPELVHEALCRTVL